MVLGIVNSGAGSPTSIAATGPALPNKNIASNMARSRFAKTDMSMAKRDVAAPHAASVGLIRMAISSAEHMPIAGLLDPHDVECRHRVGNAFQRDFAQRFGRDQLFDPRDGFLIRENLPALGFAA